MEVELYKNAHVKINNMITEIEKVIIGKRPVIQLAIAAFLAEGHVLIEDIPGVGKTMLAKALGKSIQAKVNRVQFTPDLLPNDILGISIFKRDQGKFEFKPGPIFTDILLGDEINRTTPRSQAALLEAMSEKQVTLDGKTYPLSPLFFVMATQNPTDFEGTYPLPEAQLDRFLVCITIGYPTFEEELALLSGYGQSRALNNVRAVITKGEISQLRELVREVYIDESLLDYAMQLVDQTRTHAKIKLGISPRGALAFVQAARAYALTEGRNYCLPDDFKTVLIPVFAHRLILKAGNFRSHKQQTTILREIEKMVPVPVGG